MDRNVPNPSGRFARRAACWLACLLALASTAQAAPAEEERSPADEVLFLQTFQDMVRIAAPLGVEFRVQVQQEPEDGASPVSLSYEEGRCTLLLRARGNSMVPHLLDARDGLPRALKVRALLAHEMGHCFQHVFAAPPADPASRQARHTAEVQADLFAMAWTAIYDPEDYDRVYAYLVEMRAVLSIDTSGRHARPGELDAGRELKSALRRADGQALVALVREGAVRAAP
jgi:hypothetical protein